MSDSPSITKTILVINCGSSSIKFALIEFPEGKVRATGLVDRLGTPGAEITLKIGDLRTEAPLPSAGHGQAMEAIIRTLERTLGGNLKLDGIGHRVVHGGESFSHPVRITSDVIAEIERLSKLAPLHNPANALGICSAIAAFPNVPQVAVFDTAFHQTMPKYAYLYAVPFEYYETHGIRRYGMHGTSHHYVGMEAAKLLGKPFDSLKLITAHLGNGSSACAIRNGQSVDTTMGLTPLEGLMMGTRSGDVDPGLHLHLHENLDLSLAAINAVLNKQSGLLGVSGVSNDLRSVVEASEAGNERAAIAVEMLCYRLAKGIGALCAALDSLDALVFTGGIGENSTLVREKTIGHLKVLGAAIDPARNSRHGRDNNCVISADSSSLSILVVPTNEEWMIASSTAALCQD